MDEVSTPPPVTQFHHYGISVTDLPRSLDFYCDILGCIVILPPHQDDEFDFQRAVIRHGGSMGIDLNQHAANSGEVFDPTRTGLDHLAFSVSSHEDFIAWVAYLDAKGVARSPIRNVEGVGEAIDFRDPDGIQIELWHQDPGGSWTRSVQEKVDRSSSDRR